MRSAPMQSRTSTSARCNSTRPHEARPHVFASTTSKLDASDFQEDDELQTSEALEADDAEPALEREADRLADAALRQMDSNSGNEPASSSRPALSAPTIHESHALPELGAPLAPAIREEMERAFGMDLSDVRVHVGDAAERQARAFNADAYTLGSHIVFGGGRFAPNTQSGKRLLAHELAHVLQQSQAPGSGATSTPPHVQKSPRTAPNPEPEAQLPASFDAPAAKRDTTSFVDLSPPPVETLSGPPGESTPPPLARRQEPTQKSARIPDDRTSAAIELPGTEPSGADATQQSSTLTGATGGEESDSYLPRTADLLPAGEQPEAVSPLEPPNIAPTGDLPANRYSLPATDDDVKLFAKHLRNGSRDARIHLSSQASKACAVLDRDRTKADELVGGEKKHADGVVEKALEKRRSDLELTLDATLASINWQEGIRKKEAETHGADAKLEMAWTVSKQRGRMERAVEKWAGYIDTLRDFHIGRIKADTAKNIPLTTAYAELYERTFLRSGRESAGRVEVQRDAAFALAKGLAEEFRKIEPEAIRLTRETTAEMAGKVYEFADKTYAEFDKNLPQLLIGIDDQVKAAQENIAQKARNARGKLDVAATKARGRLKDVETSWYERNASVETQVKDKVKTVHDDTERGYRRSVSHAMQPISTIVNEAVDVVGSGDPLDIDASWQFVGEVSGFANDAAESAGELFVSASEGISESFKRPGSSARRALAAEGKNYKSILKEEGAGQELALIKFESAVDASYADSITTLDKTFAVSRSDTTKGLTPHVDEFLAVLEDTVMKSAKELRRAVDEPLFKQSGALERLRKREMRNVALQAAWRYDHSILKHVSDALDWIAEKVAILFVALTIILAVILLFKLAVAALAFFVGATVAKFLVGMAVAYLLISHGVKAYEKRIEEGASPVGAFFGALGEVTGVLPVYRALTDSSLSIADRGVQLGFGVLSLFGTAMAAGRLFRAVKLRFPAKITDPRIPVAAEPPPPSQIVVQPKPEVTVRGFQSRTQQLEAPAPGVVPTTTSPSTGGYARQPGQRVPISPAAPPAGVPPKPEFTVRGFLSHKKPSEPAAPVQSPATTSPSTGGYARPPGERVPITPEAPPPSLTGRQPTAPRTVPSPAPSLRGAQGTRASASVSPSSPRGSQPVKGKSESVTQPAEAATTPTVNALAVKPPTPVTRAPTVPPRRPGIVNRTLQKLYLSLRMTFDELLPSHADIAGGRIGKTPSAPVVAKAPVEGRPVTIDLATAPTPPAVSPAPGIAAVASAPKPSPTAVAITKAPTPATSTSGAAATPRAATPSDMPIAVPPLVPAPTTEAAQTETGVTQSATENVAAPTATPTTAAAPAPDPAQGQVQVLASPSRRVFHLPGSYWYRVGVRNGVLMTRAVAEAQGFRLAGSPRSPPPSGVYSVERRKDGTQIKGWIGERADRAGYEKELPSAAQYGLREIARMQRAHSMGAGLRIESDAAIRLASELVNQTLQNRGIEDFLRQLRDEVGQHSRLHLETVTATHPDTLRLESIHYKLQFVEGKRRIFAMEVVIEMRLDGSARVGVRLSGNKYEFGPWLSQ